jgi:tRNA pseudouridine38-40 synthase
VLTLQTVRPDFDARFSATGKEYRYFIWNDPQMLPDLRRHRYHVRIPLDVRAMQRAARLLEGRHDFAAFCANPGYEREGTVRRLYALRVTRHGPELTITAKGEGFLYKMVRSLAGFLVRVGLGELEPADATRILKSKERTARVPTAPGCGLFLWRVSYAKRPR